MKYRSLYLSALVAAGAAPFIALAAWQGAPGTPPSSNANGPVWLQTGSLTEQTGAFSVSEKSKAGDAFNVGIADVSGEGNFALSGDVYLTSTGKSIRVDGDGATELRIGNYNNGPADTFELSIVRNNPYAEVIQFIASNSTGLGQICLNGSCISSWPTSGGGGDLTAIDQGAGITVTNGGGPIPTVSANYNSVQARVSGSCSSGSAIRVINANGTVTCQSVSGGGGGSSSGTGTPVRLLRHNGIGTGSTTPAGTQAVRFPSTTNAINDGNWSVSANTAGPITYTGTGTIVVKVSASGQNETTGQINNLFVAKNGDTSKFDTYFSLQNGDTLWPYKTDAAAVTYGNPTITIKQVHSFETDAPVLGGPMKLLRHNGIGTGSTTPGGTQAVRFPSTTNAINDGNWSVSANTAGPITYTGTGTVVVKVTASGQNSTSGQIEQFFIAKNGDTSKFDTHFSLQNGDTLWPYKTGVAAASYGNPTITIEQIQTF